MEDVKSLSAGQKVKGRIVSICYSTQQVYVSTLPTTQNVVAPPTLPTIGETREDGEVAMIDSGCGVMLKPNVYIHLNRMRDTRVESAEQCFSMGMKNIKYRVIGYDLIDDMVLVHSVGDVPMTRLPLLPPSSRRTSSRWTTRRRESW